MYIKKKNFKMYIKNYEILMLHNLKGRTKIFKVKRKMNHKMSFKLSKL